VTWYQDQGDSNPAEPGGLEPGGPDVAVSEPPLRSSGSDRGRDTGPQPPTRPGRHHDQSHQRAERSARARRVSTGR
jgi:hypothetical protein